MVKEAPETVKTNYVVTAYSDMEFADDIKICCSFDNYNKALEEYNNIIEKVGHTQFVTLELELEIDENFPVENIRLADNFKQVLFYTIVADFGDDVGTATFLETDDIAELYDKFDTITKCGDGLYENAYNSMPLIKAEKVSACVVLEGGTEEVLTSFNIPKETVDI